MNPLLVIVLFVILAGSLFILIRRNKHGSSCCGNTHQTEKKIHSHSDKKQLTCRSRIRIGGMVCAACALHIQNELNRIDGIQAKVCFETRDAVIRYRPDVSEKQLKQIIRSAGYTVLP